MTPDQIPHQILAIVFFLPLAGALIIALSKPEMARKFALVTSGLMVIVSVWMATMFDVNQQGFQFSQMSHWVTLPFPVDFHIGVDGMGLCLVVLTTIIGFFSIWASETITSRPKLYYSFVMLLLFSILGVFVSLDLIMFFIMYEFELVPMYFLIAIWGGPRRDYAAMKFLLYTFFGGILMLGGILFAYFNLYAEAPASATFNMIVLAQRCPLLPMGVQTLAFLGFFLAFIIKLPSFPFHTWLPDAHVEAPTPISMILAGLLLKMGSYGLFRICIGFFPQVVVHYGWLIMSLGCFNIVWAAMACLVQQDMKRIIAFSSVSHMGFILLGMGALSAAAINGAIFQMLSHGFISAMLFFMVGCVYERTHTRQLPEIGGGLAQAMPTLFYFWMFACLANLGLPALSGFVAETAIYYGAFTSWVATVSPHAETTRTWIYISATGVLLTAGYMLWLLKRLFFGPIQAKWKGHLSDIRPSELALAYALTAMILLFGLYPYCLTKQYQIVADRMSANLMSKTSISMNETQPVR